jgi:hypothetical protein
MYSDITMTSVEVDHRRAALLEQARQHRLATVARDGRRALRRTVDEAVARLVARGAPPERREHGQAAAGMCVVDASAHGKAGANRR